MKNERSTEARAPLAFFGITFAITWPCFTLVAISPANSPWGTPVLYLGIFAPSIAALLLTWISGGRSGVVALLRRLVQWRTGVRWYLFAIGFMAAIKIAVALVYRMIAGAWPQFGHERPVVMLAAMVLSTITGGQAGEEIGWRGYALPALADRFGYRWAALLLGPIWAVWHLPLFFMRGADTFGQSFPLYALQVTALSVALAWLYRGTDGSLLLTMLMHAAVNNTKDIVPSAAPGASNPFTFSASLVGWLTVLLLWIFASYFLWRMRSALASAS